MVQKTGQQQIKPVRILPYIVCMWACIALAFTCFSQNLRPEVALIVDSIAKGPYEHMYPSGKPMPQWARGQKLGKLATEEELLLLCEHPNPVVKCYAFKALSNRPNSPFFPVLLKHLSDTSRIRIHDGCVIIGEWTGDNFLKNAQLNQAQKNTVDSLLIFGSDIRLDAKSNLLIQLPPQSDNYYERIRKMVMEENNNCALVALAKFQKQEDKPLIIEHLLSDNYITQYYGLWAVQYFPDETFYPYLATIHQKEINKFWGIDPLGVKMLYQAMVQYNDRNFRKSILKAIRKNYGHIYYIWLALKKYPSPAYLRIIPKLKPEDWRIENNNHMEEDRIR